VKPVVIVTGADLASQAVDLLKDFDLVYAGKTPDEDSLAGLCRQHRPVAIIVRYGKVGARIMDEAPGLKVIAKHGVGIDTIDVQAAAERGIAVKPATGANAAAVAEHTWALILACAKSVPYLNRRMQEGHWDKPTHKSMELAGRTLGLVGMGAIGERVAQAGIAFGMNVLAHDPFRKTAPAGVTLCGLDDLVTAAHVVSLHCPLTPENRNLFNREMISSMRDGAILVNTARGGLIDEDALIEALRAGKIRAAGLDCFAQEPVTSPQPLGAMANVICTPHIGGVTEAAYVNMGIAAARNILTVIGGEPRH
jgi:D-3-phosphoglycerate dehydrogenase